MKIRNILLYATLALVGCSAVLKNVESVITHCTTTPAQNDIRNVHSILSTEDADAKLNAMSAEKGISFVVCLVETVLNGLTASTQNDTGFALTNSTIANKTDLQPLVDRGNAWLAKHKQQHALTSTKPVNPY